MDSEKCACCGVTGLVESEGLHSIHTTRAIEFYFYRLEMAKG